MTTENNWIKHNLFDRLHDQSLDLSVDLNPNPFQKMSFHEAADITAQRIYEKHKNIFLSFSGGADSDYVFHVFQRNNIPFKPILVKTTGNVVELGYAYHTCKKFNVEPIVIEIDDKKYLDVYYKNVIAKLSGIGICAVPGVIACEYARDNNGVLVIGEHMIDHDGDNIYAGVNEWDYYNEVLVGDDFNIPFFNYTTDLTYAMWNSIYREEISEWKWKLYDLDYRPVIEYRFDYNFITYKKKMFMLRRANPNPKFILGGKEEMLSLLNNFANKYT